GFANVVRRGNIGLVAASGTGLQEVTTQIHRMGGGVSHAIGTGGRDVYADVGGATMLQGIALLAADPGTQVIAIVSKPPAPAVAQKVLDALAATGKPAVVIFLGSDLASPSPQVRMASTLVDCASLAVKIAQNIRKNTPDSGSKKSHRISEKNRNSYLISDKPRFLKSQRHLRALFSGGTYASEAQVIWAQRGLQVWSNVAIDPALDLPNPRKASREHTALDLGDDAFTVGRPHPMIDQGARIERLLQEAADPSVRVILMDVVIGWGAHANPAGELGDAILKAKNLALSQGRPLAVLGFVCGTEDDPQVLSKQEALLREAGMVLAPNSASAAWLAAEWLK
ncbi:MAG: acyl-CoA synthetase FdrA, partial [Pseudomonadota bacterium]